MARLDNLDYEVNGVTTNYEIVPEIAPLFNATTAYAAGDQVIQGGVRYKFTTAHPAGAWIGTDAEEMPTVADELTELKNDLTGIETDISTGNLTAGTAEQILSDNGMTDKAPYLFRAMPTGAGDREEPVIVGGSVAWNQLVKTISSENWATESGVTATFTDGIATISSTTAGNGIYTKNTIPTYGGHKYIVMITAKGTSGQTLSVTMPSTGIVKDLSIESSDWKTYLLVLSTAQDANTRMYVFIKGDAYENLQVKNVVLTDLTVMFNSSIADYLRTLETTEAGAGIAYIRKYGFFTKDYYPYTEPTFKHVEGLVSHRMVGFNQWDEVWEVGGISDITGADESGSNKIRSKNYIHVLPNTTYYIKTPDGYTLYPFYYDANKKFMSQGTGKQNTTFASGGSTHYIRFFLYKSGWSNPTYANNICINLSDPAKNGTYEPYKFHTYPLDPDAVLRGILKLDNNNLYYDGDVYKADETVGRRYGEVDFGEQTWNTSTANRAILGTFNTRFNAKMPASGQLANCLTEKGYTQILSSATPSNPGEFLYAVNGSLVFYYDGSNLPSGKFVYELATPTEETADPYTPLQLADPYGTEEWVLDVDAFPMPVGQETFYPENLRAKIEGLPWNFANLIAPTESGYTATRAYTNGQLFIVDNVLYQATTSIASGGTITPGTNCTATTLAEVISAL